MYKFCGFRLSAHHSAPLYSSASGKRLGESHRREIYWGAFVTRAEAGRSWRVIEQKYRPSRATSHPAWKITFPFPGAFPPETGGGFVSRRVSPCEINEIVYELHENAKIRPRLEAPYYRIMRRTTSGPRTSPNCAQVKTFRRQAGIWKEEIILVRDLDFKKYITCCGCSCNRT